MNGQLRADERYERDRRLWRGIATSVVARGVAVLAPLILVPITLNYLGASTYAIWMSAASLTAMVVFADLGLGQGLMTVLTPLLVAGQTRKAREAISATYTLLVGVALLGCLALLATSKFVDLAAVLGAEDPTAGDAAIAVACLLIFLVNVPLSLIVRVQYAAQRVGAANLWQTAGAICALVLATTSVVLDLGALLVVVAALSGPLIGNVAASFWFFRRRPDLAPRPAPRGVSAQLPTLGALGLGFLTLNIVMAVASNLDIIVVSHFDVAIEVVAFAIVIRLFGQVGSMVALVTVPLWPANAEALARGDVSWVVRTTRKMTAYATGAVLMVSLPVIAAGDVLFDVWTGEDLEISRVLLIGAAAWWLLLGGLSPFFMVQNSVGVLMPQLLGWTAFLIASVPIKVIAVDAGLTEWVPLIGAGVGVLTVLPGCMTGYRRVLRSRRGDGVWTMP